MRSHEPGDPGPSPAERGIGAETLEAALALVREWSGPRRLGILLSGSHASGDAVWADSGGRLVSLSDIDLYVVMPDERACREAERRARAAYPGLAARSLAFGLAAPLEVGFLTLEGLTRIEPRPGTLELRRSGRAVDGDPSMLERVPRLSAAKIPPEEIARLLENRGFELLASRPHPDAGALPRLRARHSVLRTALDLAGVLTLLGGEWPEGAAARVELAGARAGVSAELAGLWTEALAWRRSPGDATSVEDDDRWRRAVRGWVAVWRELTGATGRDDIERAVSFAARARLRRRWREAFGFRGRGGSGPGLSSRLGHALRGTPAHRLNASATILLLVAAASNPDGPPFPSRLPPRARAALLRLGALGRIESESWEEWADRSIARWDRWILDGQRSAAVS